jgi:hypothetical protein
MRCAIPNKCADMAFSIRRRAACVSASATQQLLLRGRACDANYYFYSRQLNTEKT